MRNPFIRLLVLSLLLASCGEARGANTGAAPAVSSTARTLVTALPSAGIGNIAVMISIPRTPRYTTSAGVVIMVSPYFTKPSGFLTDPNFTSLGLISISYLWPGGTDARTRARSDGTYDYGGASSIKALRDVIRFAVNLIPDQNGHYLTNLTQVPPLTSEVGLYAYAEAGTAVLRALAQYGDEMNGVQYLVDRENPTLDSLSSQELGYWGSDAKPVYNPLYQYPDDFSPNEITLDYKSLRWDPNYKDSNTGLIGRPYLDLKGNGIFTAGDFAFSGQVPILFGKRYYSTALTEALSANGALSAADWPATLATPQEVTQYWQSPQQIMAAYRSVGNNLPDLKVMLVFAQNDHAQVAQDKPHIHEAFLGFRFEAANPGTGIGLWVRLNPDRAYVQAFIPSAGLDFPDNPADTQPEDWTKVMGWAYPDQGTAGNPVTLAAVAEMADRSQLGDWDDNLGAVLVQETTPGP
ncbi:MAG: hypothetical protein ABSB41_14145 [Anaerolineales bacterium]